MQFRCSQPCLKRTNNKKIKEMYLLETGTTVKLLFFLHSFLFPCCCGKVRSGCQQLVSFPAFTNNLMGSKIEKFNFLKKKRKKKKGFFPDDY